MSYASNEARRYDQKCAGGKISKSRNSGYLRNESVHPSSVVRVRTKLFPDELPFLDELLAANERATELLVDYRQLDHDEVHPLAHSKGVVEEIGGHALHAGNLVHERGGVRASNVELGGR